MMARNNTQRIRYLKGRVRHFNWRIEQQELVIKYNTDKNLSIYANTQAEIILLKLKMYRDEHQEALDKLTGGEL